MPPEQKESYKVRITEPTVVVTLSGERRHAAPKEEIEVGAEACYDLVAGNKAIILEGQLPNALKGVAGGRAVHQR